MIIALDPGKQCLGWSATIAGKLTACGLLRTQQPDLGGIVADYWEQLQPSVPIKPRIVVVERMSHYPNARRTPAAMHATVADLLDLTAVSAALAGRLCPGQWRFASPAEWKGQTPKEIHNKRVLAALTAEEKIAFEADINLVPQSLRHNVIDAVGLNLWAVGRMRARKETQTLWAVKKSA